MLPLLSEHSAQFELPGIGIGFFGTRFNFWEGNDPVVHPEHSGRAADWPQGLVFAFLIDFLDENDDVVYRVYYSDSPSCSPCGFVKLADGDRAVDVAILTGGGSESMRYPTRADRRKESGYPEDLLENLCARHVIVGHWEDFFEPFTVPSKLKPLPGAERLVTLLEPSHPTACLPVPGSSFWYAPPAPSHRATCRWPHRGVTRYCGCRVEGDGSCEDGS